MGRCQIGNVSDFGLLRSGRMTKLNGQAASIAPGLFARSAQTLADEPSSASILARAGLSGRVSIRSLFFGTVAAIPAALAGTGALAGSCTEFPIGSGVFTCSGPAGADITQNLAPPAGGAIDAATQSGFGITTAAGDAISLVNVVGDTNITFSDVNASVITGNDNGIYARNNGTGFTTITTTGAVTGIANRGIFARNENTATSLTINAQGAVLGNTSGIFARHLGSGALSITSQSVTGTNSRGIYARNRNGTSLTIDAHGAVSGGTRGINAQNYLGAMSITTQAVTGNTDHGIRARNTGDSTSLTINAQGAVSGGTQGIYAFNSGTGATSITTQAVTGTAIDGIYARNENTATSLTINAQGAVLGNTSGIIARHLGSGALSITSQSVTGTNSRGIYARNRNGTSLTIDAQGAVSGGTRGINAQNYLGAMSITTQAVTGNTDHGIRARNTGDSTSLTINAQGAVSGGTQGVYARSRGTGATSITTQAVTGVAEQGIYALNESAATSLTINAQGAVSGGTQGVYARNDGSGDLTITTQAAVTGGSGYGIETVTGAGGNTVITLNAGAAVSSTAGMGISNDAGDSTTVVNAGASVAGTISLGDGSDSFTFAGGDFSGVTLFDGGDDTSAADGFVDTLTLAGSGGTIAGASVVNWENVVIGAGATVSFSDNVITAGDLSVDAGGVLSATSGVFMINANLMNAGVLSALDGATDDGFVVAGDYVGGGIVELDVDLSTDTADTLTVLGTASGGPTTVAVNNIGNTATGNDLLLIDLANAPGAGDFALAAPVSGGGFQYDLALVGNDFLLQQSGILAADASFEVYPQILLSLNSLPTLRQRMPWEVEAYDDDLVSRSNGGNGAAQSGPIWARVDGLQADMSANTSTTDSSYDLRQWKLHTGIDFVVHDGDAGALLLGLNGYAGSVDADVTSATGNGSIETEGKGVGLTATWFGTGGFYVDGQAQYSWFDSDLSVLNPGDVIGANQGTGQAFSLEAGKRIDLSNGWTITPQAQVTYAAVDFDSFSSGGSQVTLEDGETTTARLGIDFGREVASGSATGRSSQFYGLANLHYDVAGTTRVDVGGVDFSHSADWISGEIGVGGSLEWANQYRMFGEVSAASSLDDFGENARFKGSIGVNVDF